MTSNSDKIKDFALPVSPNKSLQRSVTHKVLGRGRSSQVLTSLPRARVLNSPRAAPELSRQAALRGAHMIARAGSLVALLLAAACQPLAAQPDQFYSGMFVWGAEVRTFAPCGQKVRYWVSGPSSVTAPLLEFYRKNTTQPYGRIYITLRGQLLDEERDGFAADYDGLLKVSQVLSMSKEAPRACVT